MKNKYLTYLFLMQMLVTSLFGQNIEYDVSKKGTKPQHLSYQLGTGTRGYRYGSAFVALADDPSAPLLASSRYY